MLYRQASHTFVVTTVVVGVLAAVVIPAMVKQTTAADAPRVASDLGSVKAAIEVFAQDVRPRMPGEIRDLVDPITIVRLGIDGVNYTQTNVDKWKGPYLEWTADAGLALQAVIFKSGGDASIVNGLFRCPGASTQNSYANASGEFGDSPCLLFNDTSGNDATDRYVSVKVRLELG